MMKQAMRFYLCVMLLMAFGITAPVYAENSKIGYVDSARVMNSAPQAEAARKMLKDEFAPRDQKLVQQQNKLKKLEEDLSRDAAVMSESVRLKKEREIISLKRDIKRAQEEFSEDLNLRRNEELGKLQKVIIDAIVAVAKDEEYDAIVGDTVLYASQRIDITDKVLERLRRDTKN